MKYVIDGDRAGLLLEQYVRRWKYELTDQLFDVKLAFELEPVVAGLCGRIADDLDLDLRSTDRQVRALLSAKLNMLRAHLSNEPDAELFSSATRLTDEQILAKVFRTFIPKVRLPRGWNGQPFG